MERNFFLIQSIQFLTLYIIFQFWDNTSWWQDKEKEILFLVVSYLIYMILTSIIWFLKPISIEVNQSSIIGSDIEQTVVFQSNQEIKTHQMLRTIRVDVKLTRKKSIWWFLLLKLIQRRNLDVVIEPIPKGIYLQPKDITAEEIEITRDGYKINLNNLLEEMSTFSGTFEVARSYPYVLTDHEEIIIADNLSSIIIPRIYYNNKPVKFLSLLIKTAINKHNVRYYNKGE